MAASSLIAGRYAIERPLGAGTGGETFLARDRDSGNQFVALKLLPAGSAAEEIRTAFLRECQLLSRLDHPLIARLLDSGSDQDFLYYASEYVEGGDVISEAKLRDWNAVFLLIVQAAWALQYLHDHGVIHGDLKPANLLVGKIHRLDRKDLHERATLKIIDFGLARLIEAKPQGMRGSVPYMAPEMIAGQEYDQRADLYSFGLVLYEIAWGKLPHKPQDSFARYLERLRDQEIDLSPLKAGELPNGILELISKLTQKDPKDRPQRADILIDILNKSEGEKFPREFSEALLWRELPQLVTADETAALSGLDDPVKIIHHLIEQGRFEEAEQRLNATELSPLEQRLLGTQLAYRQGRYDTAEQTLSTIDAMLLNDATAAQRTRYESAYALLFQARKKWSAAAAAFERAAAHAAEAGRSDQQASLLANAGGLYFDQVEWQKGFATLSQALDLARGLGNQGLVATVASNLGNLYLYFGRWMEASDLLLESLDLAKAQGMKPLAISSLCLLTVCEEGRGNPERIKIYLDQVLVLAEELAGTQAILQAFLAKGYFELSQQNGDACRQTIEQLLRRAEGDAYYRLQARWLDTKLRIAEGEIEAPELDACLAEVEQDAQEREALLSLWQVAADRGELAQARGDSAVAHRAYEDSLETIESLRQRVPKRFQESFLRDRKKEKVRQALASLEKIKIAAAPSDQTSTDFRFATPIIKETPMETTQTLTFQKWNAISRRLLQQRNLDALLDEILDTAIELTDAERGFIIHSKTQDLDVKSGRNYSREDLENEDGRYSQTIAREVLRKGKSVVVLDATQDERFSLAASVHEVGIRSVLCVPLQSVTGTVGLIYLDNRIRPGVFKQDQLPLLNELAAQASLVLEHTRLHHENGERIVELQKARETIEQLNAELQKDLGATTASLEVARENLRRQNEEVALRYSYDKIIGRSPAILEVLRSIDRIVDTDMNIFIYGESGTGKELVARAIHFNSRRKDKPFVAENCAAIPETLFESELFGHVRGAFTGADQDRMGLFELASGGTLFLDEIGELSLTMQAKLLRVLQEKEIRRVGGQDYYKIDVRVVSASNKNLKSLVAADKFREDLFYRLQVARISLPSLRQRPEDIPLLLEHFLEKEAEASGTDKKPITNAALKILADYDWPGNIRELENEVKRATILGPEIVPELLSPHIIDRVNELRGSPLGRGLDTLVAELEKKAIAEALQKAGGNKVKTAQLLKINRRTLYAKLDRYKIGEKKRVRASGG